MQGEELAPAVDERTPQQRRRAAVLKLLVLVAILGVAFVLARYSPLKRYLTGEEMVALLARLRGAWWTPIVLLALHLVLGATGAPISIAVMAGGVIFGPVLGSVYNVVGTFLSAVVSFLVGRALGRDFIVHFAGKRLQPIERYLAQRGFWPLVRARFIPFPFVVVNYGAAMAGVPLGLFAAASATGLAPSVTVYTYFWAAVAAGAKGASWKQAAVKLFIAISLLMMLSLVPNVVRWLRRARTPR